LWIEKSDIEHGKKKDPTDLLSHYSKGITKTGLCKELWCEKVAFNLLEQIVKTIISKRKLSRRENVELRKVSG
jgi:hypothetical protein